MLYWIQRNVNFLLTFHGTASGADDEESADAVGGEAQPRGREVGAAAALPAEGLQVQGVAAEVRGRAGGEDPRVLLGSA